MTDKKGNEKTWPISHDLANNQIYTDIQEADIWEYPDGQIRIEIHTEDTTFDGYIQKLTGPEALNLAREYIKTNYPNIPFHEHCNTQH